MAANREWFAEALQRDPLLQAAQAWAEAGKPTNMLYRDEQLQAAEYETETAETVVVEFMEASQQAQREREFVVTRARERRTRWFAGLL